LHLPAGICSGINGILQKLKDFQVAIPSWALGTGGTRFGRFSGGGEPRSLEEKIEDVGLLHAVEQGQRCHLIAYSLGYPGRCCANMKLASHNMIAFRCG
jgi:L-rhamnose isomerase/sugar isomerase